METNQEVAIENRAMALENAQAEVWLLTFWKQASEGKRELVKMLDVRGARRDANAQ